MTLEFSSEEISILKDICDIQIESYSRILANHLNEDDKLLLNQYEGSLEALQFEARWKIQTYKEIKKLPQTLGIAEDSELLTMRHILFRMEEEYITEYGQSVFLLWEKFFTIEENRYLRLKVNNNTIKNVKLCRKGN